MGRIQGVKDTIELDEIQAGRRIRHIKTEQGGRIEGISTEGVVLVRLDVFGACKNIATIPVAMLTENWETD